MVCEIPISIIIALGIVAYLMIGLVVTFVCAKFYNQMRYNDPPPPGLMGGVWPLSIPIGIIVLIGIQIVSLFMWVEDKASDHG